MQFYFIFFINFSQKNKKSLTRKSINWNGTSSSILYLESSSTTVLVFVLSPLPWLSPLLMVTLQDVNVKTEATPKTPTNLINYSII